MRNPQNNRRIWIMGGGAVVLLLVMLVAPQFAPSASPNSLPDEPSISSEETGAEGLTGRPATAQVEVEDAGAPSLFSAGIIFRVLLAGAVLAAAVFALHWWNRRASGPRSATGFIRVVDTLPISGGRAIHLVEVGDRVLAVGATAQQLSLITELTDDEADSLRDRIAEPAEQPLGALAQQLMQQLRREDQPRAQRNMTIGEDA